MDQLKIYISILLCFLLVFFGSVVGSTAEKIEQPGDFFPTGGKLPLVEDQPKEEPPLEEELPPEQVQPAIGVESIEIIKVGTTLQYESFYYPVFGGMEINLHLEDDTIRTVVVDNCEIEYTMNTKNGTLSYSIFDGEYTIFVEYTDSDLLGEYYLFQCQEAVVEYTACTFSLAREVKSITVLQFDPHGDALMLQVLYTNRTREILSFEKVYSQVYDSVVTECFGLTENGILRYDIQKLYNEKGRLEGYNLFVLGFDVVVEKNFKNHEVLNTVGDVNQDGRANAQDALVILNFAVGKRLLNPLEKTVADVNKDNVINAKDALEVLRIAVGK